MREHLERDNHSEAVTVQSIMFSFWTIFSSLIFCSSALEYSNRWTVEIDGENGEADRLARKHGFINYGKIIDNYFSFINQKVERVSKVPSPHLHKGLMSEPNVKMVYQQEMKYYKLLSADSMHFYSNDPRYDEMWYINRDDGKSTYNVIDVWERNITGAGVVVAVVDVGIDPEHPEIQANYDARASFDVNDNDANPFPSDSSGHGDRCAGVIAAVLNNSNCGVGLAYNANLGGIRLFFEMEATDDLECRALSHEKDYIDIYSNSWGAADTGFTVVGPGPLTQRALKIGTEEGRGGLGSIYVFSAGNGGVEDSCAFDGYVNSIYTISITGITSSGTIPRFGENCAGIMAVTYARDWEEFDKSKVITADTNKTCTDRFGGSSASAAMASGLIALMLSANPRLSWRDVQHIVARTSRPNPVNIRKDVWTVNKANLSVYDYVGFGLMDATKMVDAALNWTTVPAKVNCTIPYPRANRPIPSKGTMEETIDLSVSKWGKFCGEQINYLEHVEVSLKLNYTRRGDLLIKLISPQGTVSNLTHVRPKDSVRGFTDLNSVLMTLHHWGENAIGSWKLTLENSQVKHSNTGILFNWTLILHGTVEDPLAQNRHVLTPAIPQPAAKPAKKETPTETSPKPTAKPSKRETPTETSPKSTAKPSTKETATDTSLNPWIIVTIVAVMATLASWAGFLYMYLKHRKRKGEAEEIREPEEIELKEFNSQRTMMVP